MLLKLNSVTTANWLAGGLLFAMLVMVAPQFSWGQEPEKKTTEPVFRVPKIAKLPVSNRPPRATVGDAKKNVPAKTATETTPKTEPNNKSEARLALNSTAAANATDRTNQTIVPRNIVKDVAASVHPLDRAVAMAHEGLLHMQNSIFDYTAIMVKRERVGETLSEPFYMKVKIRNERVVQNRKIPFSIYMKFLRPSSVSGREVIWVQGRHKNQLIAHEKRGSLKGMKRFHLDPEGWIAMQGNRYPIYDAGLENLVIKLIEKAERDRAAGVCEVNYVESAMINKRPCLMIEVIHKQEKSPYEFYRAKVYIDKQLNVPVRYVAYDWPVNGQKPQLMEEYTYINIKLNVGLTDQDFSPDNPAYSYPRF